MKHRVWCKNKNEWEKDITLIDADGNVFTQMGGGGLQYVNMMNHVLEYSTGETDKNGVEIFAGDKMSITIFDCFDHDTQHEVEVINNGCSMDLYSAKTGEHFDVCWAIQQDGECEVIGHVNEEVK